MKTVFPLFRLRIASQVLSTVLLTAGVAALVSGDDKTASLDYAKLFRKYALELDEKRTDDVILEALAALRPGDEEDAATPAGDADGAPAKPADDNDPFGGK